MLFKNLQITDTFKAVIYENTKRDHVFFKIEEVEVKTEFGHANALDTEDGILVFFNGDYEVELAPYCNLEKHLKLEEENVKD